LLSQIILSKPSGCWMGYSSWQSKPRVYQPF
jgi:hypothetical protein